MHMYVAAGMLAAELAVAPGAPKATVAVPEKIVATPANSVPAQGSAQNPVVIAENWAAPTVTPNKGAVSRAVRQTMQEADAEAKAEATSKSKAAAIPVRYTMSSRRVDQRDKYEKFGAGFDHAKKPSCLAPNGLKHQNTFIFGGLLAAPFILVAAIRGKCN